jgi:hypothetical protein
MAKYRIKVAGMWCNGLWYKVEWHCEARRGFASLDGMFWARSGIVGDYEEVNDG